MKSAKKIAQSAKNAKKFAQEIKNWYIRRVLFVSIYQFFFKKENFFSVIRFGAEFDSVSFDIEDFVC